MTGFKFPPPPPPPPKAAAAPKDNSTYLSSQRGRHSNTRSDRGGPGRGRENVVIGNSRGGQGQTDSQSHGNHNGRGRGGQQYHGKEDFRQQHAHGEYLRGKPRQQLSTSVQQSNVHVRVPSGLHSNPAFADQAQWAAPAQPPVDPMATQSEMQTVATFVGHDANSAHVPHQQPPPLYNPAQQDDRKRKRNTRAREWSEENKQHSRENAQKPPGKPPRAKVAAPPAVPSFGFSLPQSTQPPKEPPSKTSDQSQKKRRVHLGLAPRADWDTPVVNSSEEEDIDEEAAFAADFKGMTFEYEGKVMSLQTPAELYAWRKDRKRQYPTRRRVEQKAQDAEAKRAGELDFLRKVKGLDSQEGKTQTSAPQKRAHSTRVKTASLTPDLSRQKKLEELRRKAQASRSIAKSDVQTSSNAVQPINLGLGYASDTEGSSNSAVSSVVSSSEESSNEDSDSDDSGSAPQERSSKTVVPLINVAPPALTNAQPKSKPLWKGNQAGVCERWEKWGKCKYGHSCQFPHPPKGELKRVRLYDKMVEQEKDQANQLALEAIKYLGSHGFFG